MILSHADYRQYLKAELVTRIERNGSYSSSAMAKQLGLAASSFHEILKGTKNLSPARAIGIASRLGLEGVEAEYFCQLVQLGGAQAARSPELKAAILMRLRALNPRHDIRDLSVDHFKMIAEWYHLPILALTQVSGFKLTPESAAQALGIHPAEAEAALTRMLALEILERAPEGEVRAVGERWLARSPIPNSALRRYHRQMLTKAIESLESQTPQEKFVGSETFGLDPEQLPEAVRITERYFDEMLALGERAKRRRKVYHLGAQLFDLTRNLKAKGSK
jgi:uncharacterized protein (TIGR02147 family)